MRPDTGRAVAGLLTLRHHLRMATRLLARVAACLVLWLGAVAAHAGGPHFVAGTTYFDPAVTGKPVIWNSGRVSYFVDQGDLSSSVDHATALAAVAAAAATWSSVATAAILITQSGSLAEDVSSANVVPTAAGLVLPADIQPSAAGTPVGIIFDADGSVLDAFYGTGASASDDCTHNGVVARVDNLAASGSIVHALILVNGRCTGTPAQLLQIQFQLIRAFGRVLGLDWSQANDAVLSGPGDPSLQQLQGWPLMRPIDLNCNQLSVECIPSPLELRPDDVASISRLYPVTASNQAQYAGKQLTAAATLSIHGTIRFHRGQGMQGVNVIARPISAGLALADDRYTVTSVSGFLYTGNRGNPITGAADPSGTSLARYGSTDPADEGSYDLSGIVLPPGNSQADYEISLEPVNPLYTGAESVGPYASGSPTPSGALPSIILRGLAAGMSIQQDFTISGSALDEQPGTGGPAAAPAVVPPGGEWNGRVAVPGQAEWYALAVQGGRHFTIETQALGLDANNPAEALASENKLRAVLGIWSGAGPTTGLPVNAAIAPFNGASPGVSAVSVDAIGNGELLLAIADQRGDGRPDYVFHGRLLYAGSVSPQHLPLSGGPITITGSGFRPGMVLTLGQNMTAPVTYLNPATLIAIAPPAAAPTGSLDLVLTDPATHGVAALAAGISYGAGSSDTLSVVTALPANLAAGVASAFTVRALGPDQVTPVGGIPVTFTVLNGSAVLSGCAPDSCMVATTGDGLADIQVTATLPGPLKILAGLSTGSTVAIESVAVASPAITALTSALFLAPSVTWSWNPQVQVWNGTGPAAGQPVDWSFSGPLAAFSTTTLTSPQGIASNTLSLGPWAPGFAATLQACVHGTNSCAPMLVYTAHPETELLSPISGIRQTIANGQQPGQVLLRLLAPAGQPIAGGVVTLSGTLRSRAAACPGPGPCPPGRVIATVELSASSAADGSVNFLPTIAAGQPGVLTAIATAGASSTVPVVIRVLPQ